MFVFAAVLLCSAIPSQVAFTSPISAVGVPTIAAYGLIALLRRCGLRSLRSLSSRRTFISDAGHDRCTSQWCCSTSSSFWCVGYVVFTASYTVLTGDLGGFATRVDRPVLLLSDSQHVHFACTIFGPVSMFAMLYWYLIPPIKWLWQEQIERALHTTEGHPNAVETPTNLQGTM